MFGAANRTITGIYSPTYSNYGAVILGSPATVALRCWFEETYQERRNAAGDTYIVNARILLPYNASLTEGKIIEINSERWKIALKERLEDFSGNPRLQLDLTKQSA